MSISLQKGQKVSLSKENKGLSTVLVGLGWDEAMQKKEIGRARISIATRRPSFFGTGD